MRRRFGRTPHPVALWFVCAQVFVVAPHVSADEISAGGFEANGSVVSGDPLTAILVVHNASDESGTVRMRVDSLICDGTSLRPTRDAAEKLDEILGRSPKDRPIDPQARLQIEFPLGLKHFDSRPKEEVDRCIARSHLSFSRDGRAVAQDAIEFEIPIAKARELLVQPPVAVAPAPVPPAMEPPPAVPPPVEGGPTISEAPNDTDNPKLVEVSY